MIAPAHPPDDPARDPGTTEPVGPANPYAPPRSADRPTIRWSLVVEGVVMWVLVAPAILAASAVAFVMTCLPLGAIFALPALLNGDPSGSPGLTVAAVISLMVALGTAYSLVRAIQQAGRRLP